MCGEMMRDSSENHWNMGYLPERKLILALVSASRKVLSIDQKTEKTLGASIMNSLYSLQTNMHIGGKEVWEKATVVVPTAHLSG